MNSERGGLWKEAVVLEFRYYANIFPKGLRETSNDPPGQPLIGHKSKQEFPEYRTIMSLLSQYVTLSLIFDDPIIKNKLSSILFPLLTHCGPVTQIFVFTLKLCKTDDVNLRF